MEFAISTIDTVSAAINKKPQKREAQAIDDDAPEEATMKKSKRNDGSPTPNTTSSIEPLNSDRDQYNIAKAAARRKKPSIPNKAKAAKIRYTKKDGVDTKLLRSKPVTTALAYEHWKNILGHCPPEFLLKVARHISKACLDILSKHKGDSENLWKLARLREYGSDHPDPPPEITERQYADLLTDVGCQGCDDSMARRTYWAYQRRWCASCHAAFTVKGREKDSIFRQRLPPMDKQFTLSDCIPAVKYDSWHHYQWVGDFEVDEVPDWAARESRTPRYHMYEDKVYKAFMTKLDTFLAGSPTKAEAEEWFEAKKEANKAYVKKLQAIENWQELVRAEKVKKAAALREKRAKYFEEQAALMDPPMAADAVRLCKSYNSAVASPHEPTEKSWMILRCKLEKERKEAEADLLDLYREQLLENFDLMVDRREYNDSPEQRCVLSIADAVMEEVILENSRIADQDLVAVILRRVYEAYQQCENKSDGLFGKHRLIMDDARMIYRTKIMPMLDRVKGRGVATEKATALRCPGCPQDLGLDGSILPPDSYSFTKLIEDHINFDHIEHPDLRPLTVWQLNSPVKHPGLAPLTESFTELIQRIREFDWVGHFEKVWMCVEWPRNLPILASHQESDGHWDLQGKGELEYLDEPESLGVQHGVSMLGPEPDDFIPSIFYAALRLQNLGNIDRKTKASMIMDFARARWEHVREVDEVPAVFLQRMREALTFCAKHCDIAGMFDGFHCGVCSETTNEEGEEVDGMDYIFDELCDHYEDEHDEGEWIKEMFNFEGIERAPELMKRLAGTATYATLRELFPLLAY